MSIKNIAGIVGKTENSTKITLYRARKKLGRILKEDDYEF
jgi:RNA polymerase sigma-70 factor (ECF subfamily)